MGQYSLYCILECPIGKPKSDEFLKSNNSGFDASKDMQIFVDECIKVGCPNEKECQEYDRKGGDNNG